MTAPMIDPFNLIHRPARPMMTPLLSRRVYAPKSARGWGERPGHRRRPSPFSGMARACRAGGKIEGRGLKPASRLCSGGAADQTRGSGYPSPPPGAAPRGPAPPRVGLLLAPAGDVSLRLRLRSLGSLCRLHLRSLHDLAQQFASEVVERPK